MDYNRIPSLTHVLVASALVTANLIYPLLYTSAVQPMTLRCIGTSAA